MKPIVRGLSRIAEGVAGIMMLAMFATFILQIIVRYVIGAEWTTVWFGLAPNPSMWGWTLEFCLVLWVWIVFWGNAFVVRDRDHVTFDILYLAVSPRVRKWFIAIGCTAVIVGLLYSINPTYAKMKILHIKSSATLPTKMFPIYSIYFLFLVVVPLRYMWRIYDTFRNGLPEEGHHHTDVTDQ